MRDTAPFGESPEGAVLSFLGKMIFLPDTVAKKEKI